MTQTLLLDHHLKRLRMPTVARLYPQIARDAEAEGQTYERFLLALLEAEVQAREASTQRERIKKAKFPWAKDFEDYDFAAVPGVSRQKLLHLAEGEYLKRHENVIFVGNQGPAKRIWPWHWGERPAGKASGSCSSRQQR